ncbi:MAG TPA: PAS domain-containing protein, partial [Burkholderiaceae bacterium]
MTQDTPLIEDAAGSPAAILDSITDAFFALDRQWLFNYANRQACIVLNKQAEELIGRSLWDVYPGVVGSEFETVYRTAMREQVAGAFTAYYPDHDRWYEVHAYPSKTGLAVYFRNATERV